MNRPPLLSGADLRAVVARSALCVSIGVGAATLPMSHLSAQKSASLSAGPQTPAPRALRLSGSAGKSCPAIEPLTLFAIFRFPRGSCDSLFRDSPSGRVLRGTGGCIDSTTMESLIADASGAGKQGRSPCFQLSGVSSGVLGFRLSTPDGDVVFFATCPSGDHICAQACCGARAAPETSTGVIRLAPADILVFPIDLDGTRYVGAIGGAMLAKAEIMKRMASFRRRGFDPPILRLSTIFVSPDTIPCLADLQRASGRPQDDDRSATRR